MKKAMCVVLSIFMVSLIAMGDTVTFKKAKAIDNEGKERKVTLVLDADTMTVHRRGKPKEVMSEFEFAGVTSLTYERAKSARILTAIFISPLALFSKGKKHWLTIEYKDSEGKGDAVILKLDKKEYRAILGEMSARCPVELERVETK